MTSEPGPGERPKNRWQIVQSRLTERRLLIAAAAAEVAAEISHSPAQMALRWVMDRPGVTSMILGARTTDQLEDNLGRVEIQSYGA